MAKVKLFRDKDDAVLEERINEFIKDKSIVDIRYEVTCINTQYDNRGIPTASCFYTSVFIVYKED